MVKDLSAQRTQKGSYPPPALLTSSCKCINASMHQDVYQSMLPYLLLLMHRRPHTATHQCFTAANTAAIQYINASRCASRCIHSCKYLSFDALKQSVNRFLPS